MKKNQLTQDELKTRLFIKDMMKAYQDIIPQFLDPLTIERLEASHDFLEELYPEDE